VQAGADAIDELLRRLWLTGAEGRAGRPVRLTRAEGRAGWPVRHKK
jgi:hypothetical protein